MNESSPMLKLPTCGTSGQPVGSPVCGLRSTYSVQASFRLTKRHQSTCTKASSWRVGVCRPHTPSQRELRPLRAELQTPQMAYLRWIKRCAPASRSRIVSRIKALREHPYAAQAEPKPGNSKDQRSHALRFVVIISVQRANFRTTDGLNSPLPS